MYIDWLQLVGRFHPVVLHLPIGLVVGIFAFELTRCIKRDERAPHAPPVLVTISAIASIVSVVTGLVLSREGYQGLGVEFHRWLGIVTALLAILLAFLRNGPHGKTRTGYCFTLALQVVTLGITGHLGGVITHGDDFLTEPFRKRSIGETQQKDAYVEVARIFESKCVSCHNPEKAKGGLQMHSLEALMKGGDSGAVVVMGSPDDSELMYRVLLPLDDEDHMPPSKKPQLTPQEIEIIRAWIAGTEPSASKNEAATEFDQSTTPATSNSTPDPTALNALKIAGVHCSELQPGSSRLWIDFSVASSPLSSERIDELLLPLAPFVQHLTLTRCDLPQSLIESPERYLSISRLDLRSAHLTDEMMPSISRLPELRELVLVGTPASDAAATHLAKTSTLQKLFVWNTAITDAGLSAITTALPKCKIDRGQEFLARTLESESDLKLTSDAPPPGNSNSAAAHKAENSTCPVSGSPVDPKYTIVYEGRVIGFCCPNCPKTFWQDPPAFLAKLRP